MSTNKFVNFTPVNSRILVPQRYHRQPVISRLVSRYGLQVNIKAASLASGSDSDGWFDLEISGNPQELTNSLSYLQGLGVDLVQLAIANHIQSNQNPQSFPNIDSNLTQRKPGILLKTQWGEEFQQWISTGETNRLRLQLCILKAYHEKPIISSLVSRYQLTVNITSAILNPNLQDDGWFDLDLWGRTKQLHSSLRYLEKLGIPIWLDGSFLHDDSNLIN
ncbi:NIL domain-containing protein [Cylindrospermum sp. FACHB-282]|uniref:NIL domain-containing protein n=1 Tax=Cylindrospermum sp. FACHB-282 TaxID=2692794 RepID=UPI001683519F|nr:NIL domain-containing protein [Cylindrospermum sp. FACHB-282]MBD2384281.1 NIL domain-containing protein [Cylindrospermum sp. FACHB-282]